MMDIHNNSQIPGRRRFLQGLLMMCPLIGFGSGRLFASPGQEQKTVPAAARHKFLANSELSYAMVYDFAFNGFFLPIVKNIGSQMNEAEYIEVLKKAAAAAGEQNGKRMAKAFPKNDLASFAAVMRNPDRFWQHVLTFDMVEDSEKAFEFKVSECLWAKTFRDANAGDIGYATVCYQDYTMASGFNPKLRLIRSKTLMQGDDCCNHRYTYK